MLKRETNEETQRAFCHFRKRQELGHKKFGNKRTKIGPLAPFYHPEKKRALINSSFAYEDRWDSTSGSECSYPPYAC